MIELEFGVQAHRYLREFDLKEDELVSVIDSLKLATSSSIKALKYVTVEDLAQCNIGDVVKRNIIHELAGLFLFASLLLCC